MAMTSAEHNFGQEILSRSAVSPVGEEDQIMSRDDIGTEEAANDMQASHQELPERANEILASREQLPERTNDISESREELPERTNEMAPLSAATLDDDDVSIAAGSGNSDGPKRAEEMEELDKEISQRELCDSNADSDAEHADPNLPMDLSAEDTLSRKRHALERLSSCLADESSRRRKQGRPTKYGAITPPQVASPPAGYATFREDSIMPNFQRVETPSATLAAETAASQRVLESLASSIRKQVAELTSQALESVARSERVAACALRDAPARVHQAAQTDSWPPSPPPAIFRYPGFDSRGVLSPEQLLSPFAKQAFLNPFLHPPALFDAMRSQMRMPQKMSPLHGPDMSMYDDLPPTKKKRTKVTDTRLSVRASRNIAEDLSGTCGMKLEEDAAVEERREMEVGVGGGSSPPGGLSCDEDEENSQRPSSTGLFVMGQKTCVLTPMHLRKAKLMFYYVRYPSSSVLKSYFPDVQFNKNNTAQLVKWFSNFREFFYIQVDKTARQTAIEGGEVGFTRDSELYKTLNMHYNRNNQLQVPETFFDAVRLTLREFSHAIALGKDHEPSWKKAIYKVIARLDEPLPDYFKSLEWMRQLAD